MSTLARRDVQDRLRQVLWPMLESVGFGIKGDVATRQLGERTDALAVQFFPANKLATWGLPMNSFSLEAGCFFSYLPRMDGLAAQEPIDPLACHVRLTPHRRMWQFRARKSPNIWAVDERGRNLDRCAQDATRVAMDIVVPWFSTFDDIDRLKRLLLDEPEDFQKAWGFGRLGSPVRCVLGGLVAAKTGDKAVARDYLQRALASPALAEPEGTHLAQAARAGLEQLTTD